MNKSTQLELNKEYAEFAKRLKLSIEQTHNLSRITHICRAFNALNAHEPITSHAVRKWLVGESIPTQPKLRTLADWLGVSAAWLRFGDSEGIQIADKLSVQEQVLISQYRKLDLAEKNFLLGVMRLMAKNNLIS
jgi:hypothetical protein